MSGITVRSPVGINRVGAQPIAPRLPSLDGVTLGILVGKPEDIHIVVTGGPGKHSAFVPTFGTSKSVTRKIEMPR